MVQTEHDSIRPLRNLEVINCRNGKRLGYVSDVAVNTCDGSIAGIDVIKDDGKCFSFSGKEILRICWGQIERIGEDVILVSIP